MLNVFLSSLQRMQLDIILTSLQDHTHVASLLGYSSPADGPEVQPPANGSASPADPAHSAATGHPDTHLAEILMKTLLRNLGFYTVSARLLGNTREAFQSVLNPDWSRPRVNAVEEELNSAC